MTERNIFLNISPLDHRYSLSEKDVHEALELAEDGIKLGRDKFFGALRMAVAELPPGAKPVHHSGRGCRYCCHANVEELERHGMGASMPEEARCYENALAERLNGILKQEYFLGFGFKTKAQAKTAVGEAVYLFNTKRHHPALKYKTPEAA